MDHKTKQASSGAGRRPLAEWLLLGSGLVLPLVAIGLFTHYARVALGVLVVAVVLLVLALGRLLQGLRRQRAQLLQLQKTLIGQRVTDPETGAALPGWFEEVLQTECRRAIREFTPLAIMQVELRGRDPVQRGVLRIELAKLLTRELSRPGDLVGLSESGMLQVLMPSTNEHCRQWIERFLSQAQLLRAETPVEVRVAACVMQPGADLNADKVRQYLLRQVAQLADRPDGSLAFEAEAPATTIPTVTYSL